MRVATVLLCVCLISCAATNERFRAKCVEKYQEPVEIERCVTAKKVTVYVAIPFLFGTFFLAI